MNLSDILDHPPGTRTWRGTARDVRNHREETLRQVVPALPALPHDLPLDVTAIPRQILSSAEVTVTEMLPELLVSELALGHLSCVEVVNAFLRRAHLAQSLVNCVTELLPERALGRARSLDNFMKKHKRPIGRLHGLPISVKEHISMKGLDCNASFCGWVGNVQDNDALILQILYNEGAIFYVRTTQPQTIMHLETASNLYGVTVNPFNRNLTAGGSSGGEGALMGLGASCVGLGTDIGGSESQQIDQSHFDYRVDVTWKGIRSPAANNGVYGFRPTAYRLPYDGILEAGGGGQEQIIGTVGPLSTSLAGIRMIMQVVLDAKPWLREPSLIPMPWQKDHFVPAIWEEPSLSDGMQYKKLKIAVMWDDGVVKPHPPVTRALNMVVEKLRRVSGIEIVSWRPYRHDYAWEIIASLYFPDAAEEEKKIIEESGEPWLPLTRFIIHDNPYLKDMSRSEIWQWTAKREEYRAAYANLWNRTSTSIKPNGEPLDMVDAILCPAGPGAAPPLGCSKYWGYTSQWNLLDYPAVVFPVTKVDPEIDTKDKNYKPRNKDDEYNHSLYEPETYVNAPVSLQLVARRFEDEKLLQTLELIQHYI